ncbi:UNVERIFIED_CONTAM: hypothetical protein HDU68_011055, partial [Siphonaria sp. JEL0065]
IHPPAVTFIGSKSKVKDDYQKAVEFLDRNPDFFSAVILRKIRTSLKNIKKYLIDGRNGSMAVSETKTIWTANVAPRKGTHLQYKVLFERQLEQNGDFNGENLFRRTFDIESALRYKASKLQHNGEFTTLYEPNVAFSLVLRVLRNGGFFHVKTQEDVALMRTPLSKQEQNEHLAWILDPENLPHRGFRTGAELILLSEAGMNMISFDRSDSNKKIDEIGQTIIADSWGFNRLSNSLSENDTDRLLRELLAGDYAEGDAAFGRRNGGGEPGRLSKEWEASIERKWKEMSVENRNVWTQAKNLGRALLPDIRFWGANGGLAEFQVFCRHNANAKGNLVCEVTGIELSANYWSVDRVINGIVAGISGEYQNGHCLIMHERLNDFKEVIIFHS